MITVGLRFHFGWYSDRKKAAKMLAMCRLLIPATLALCSEYDFKGIFLASPYLSYPAERSHVGYVLFIHSLAKFQGTSDLKPHVKLENIFGEGACSIIESFLKLNYDVWKSVGLPDRTIADMDLAYRSQCGIIATDFLMVDSNVICIKEKLEEGNPLLIEAAKAGLKKMFWLPLTPITMKH